MSRTKAPSLAESMQNVARTPSATAAAGITEQPSSGFYAATRAGKKKVTVALDPAAHRQFRWLAIELDRSGEDLLAEAISDLFEKYNKPRIA